jgi:Ca2+-binding RTX toxin-like protein
VNDVDASDVDNLAELTYLIGGGADWDKFSIDADGVLTFNTAPDFDSPADADGDNVYNVDVMVSDEHGAADVRSISITVMENDSPLAIDDNIITNVFEQPFNIPEWALLANDSDPDGDAIDVRNDGTIADSAAGGTATHVPGNGPSGYVEFTQTSEEGANFNYQVLDQRGAASGLPGAFVTVSRDLDGNPDLDGTPNDDILLLGLNSVGTSVFGWEGNDILVGEAGDDTLSGGAGDDILHGGAGSDLLAGDEGSDIFDYNALSDAGDTVTDFSKADGDKLDLHDLLATLEILGGSENAFDAGYLRFTAAGSDTLVEVSGDGDPASFVTLATLNGVVLEPSDTDCYIL